MKTQALAGGIGLVGGGGFHTEIVRYYENNPEMTQHSQTQFLGQSNLGLDFILGDRDDKITGIFRIQWNMDAPQTNPADTVTDVDVRDDLEVRDTYRHTGMGAVGLQFGFLGSPQRFQLAAHTLLGAGFLAWDHREYLYAEVGLTPTYAINRTWSVFANASYQARYRKGFSHGATAYAGIRFFFD